MIRTLHWLISVSICIFLVGPDKDTSMPAKISGGNCAGRVYFHGHSSPEVPEFADMKWASIRLNRQFYT